VKAIPGGLASKEEEGVRKGQRSGIFFKSGDSGKNGYVLLRGGSDAMSNGKRGCALKNTITFQRGFFCAREKSGGGGKASWPQRALRWRSKFTVKEENVRSEEKILFSSRKGNSISTRGEVRVRREGSSKKKREKTATSNRRNDSRSTHRQRGVRLVREQGEKCHLKKSTHPMNKKRKR